MKIRTLTGDDAACFRKFRLFGMQESPSAFGSSYEEASALSMEELARRLEGEEEQSRTFGGFEGEELVAVAGIIRDGSVKGNHKATVWGMYVRPDLRGRGFGRQIMNCVLAEARSWDGLVMLKLSVIAPNLPARKLYESCGFRSYGTEPNSLLVEGRYHDEEYMVIELDGASSGAD